MWQYTAYYTEAVLPMAQTCGSMQHTTYEAAVPTTQACSSTQHATYEAAVPLAQSGSAHDTKHVAVHSI